MGNLERVLTLIDRISFVFFETKFFINAQLDKKEGHRIFIQVSFLQECKHTYQFEEWKGRKWYLSDHMIDDEIVKTCFAACKAAVEHEVMESFKVDDKILFNPHINFEALLSIAGQEVKRS